MNFQTNCLLLLFVASLSMSIGMPAASIAQNWQDPVLQQPVQQYFSGDRYPLNGTSDAAVVAPTVTPTPPFSETVSPRVDEMKLGDVSPMVKTKRQTKPKVTEKKTVSKPPVDKKTSGRKQTSAKKSAKGKPKKKVDPQHPVKTWDVYRDRTPYPIDPRKPCSVCKREVGSCDCGCQHANCGIGNQGMPWQDTEPGGRSCGKKGCGDKRPEFSVYWPKPLSVKRANREGGCQGCGHAKCRCRKVNDLFDHLVNFRLVDYQRKDNGYCGPGADPYGCLGESRSQVAGVGFRFPSEPIRR